MANSLVSVVIPAYNRELFIVPAIRSVQEQGIEDIEIVIVDDCSTDKTVEKISGIDDPRIRLVRHEKNKGEAGARNTGVREARGKYVAYLDSDDQWLPGKLKAQLDHMESSVNAGGVYTLHYRLYKNGKKSITGYSPDNRGLTFENLLTKGASISAGSTLLFRRELYDRTGPYDETTPLYVDWDWLLRFVRIASLDLILHPYAVYEKNPNFRKGAVQQKAAEIFLAKYADEIEHLPEKNRNECKSRIYLDVARCYAENEGLKYAIPYYYRALKLKPDMSAGSFLNIFDGVCGTNILSHVDSFMRKDVRKAR